MILDQIVEHKRTEVAEQKRRLPESAIREQLAAAPAPRGFADALRAKRVALIAEVKKASPSKGLIRPDFDPVAIAHAYAQNGAAAISVLTDARFFKGSLDVLRQVRAAVDIPILRKEFVIDPYQLIEARAAGADAVLLIVACLGAERLGEMMDAAAQLGLETLVEVHDEAELKIALGADAPVIGINNRDLRTFETRLDVTRRLRPRIPAGRLVVSESGIFTRTDIDSLADIDAVLVGEALMRQEDVGAAVQALLAPAARDVSA